MIRQSRAWLVPATTLLLMFPAALSAGTEATTIFIAPCANCIGDTNSYFTQTIGFLGSELTHVHFVDEMPATYEFKDTTLARDNDPDLAIRVNYNSRPLFGNGHANKLKDRIDEALDSLLAQTIFKPGGPYEQLKIVKCKKLKDRDAFELQVTWGGHGLGFEPELYYEFVTVLKAEGERPYRTRIFVFFDPPVDKAGDTAIAAAFAATTGVSLECPATPFFLLMHTNKPSSIERQHASLPPK